MLPNPPRFLRRSGKTSSEGDSMGWKRRMKCQFISMDKITRWKRSKKRHSPTLNGKHIALKRSNCRKRKKTHWSLSTSKWRTQSRIWFTKWNIENSIQSQKCSNKLASKELKRVSKDDKPVISWGKKVLYLKRETPNQSKTWLISGKQWIGDLIARQ